MTWSKSQSGNELNLNRPTPNSNIAFLFVNKNILYYILVGKSTMSLIKSVTKFFQEQNLLKDNLLLMSWWIYNILLILVFLFIFLARPIGQVTLNIH